MCAPTFASKNSRGTLIILEYVRRKISKKKKKKKGGGAFWPVYCLFWRSTHLQQAQEFPAQGDSQIPAQFRQKNEEKGKIQGNGESGGKWGNREEAAGENTWLTQKVVQTFAH